MKRNRTVIPLSARLWLDALLFMMLLGALEGFAQSPINYAEALQKSIYFYDAQRSGVMPPYGYAPGQNRVRWLTSQHTYDGYDLQLPVGGMWNGLGQHVTDANKAGALQGGFRDAGDHPKWASSIGFATCMLAWAGVEQYNEFVATGQLPYLLENIKWGTDYMLRSFLYTDVNDPDTYRIVCVVSDYRAEHAVPNAASNLLEHRVPQRPHYYIDKDVPNTPHVAKYAAAMATASILFRRVGNTAYADLLYTNALRLHNFMAQYRGIGAFKRADGTVINANWRLNQNYFDTFVSSAFGPNKLPEKIDFTLYPNMAMRAPGSCPDYIIPQSTFSAPPPAHNHILPQSVQTDWGNYMYYTARSAAESVRIISDELAYAHIWMHLAEVEKNGNTPLATFHLNKAIDFFDNVLTDISSGGVATCSTSEPTPPGPRPVYPLRGPGYMNYDAFAAILLNRLAPSDPRYRQALENLVDFVISRPTSPGGLTYVMGFPTDVLPQGASSSDPFESWGVFEQLTPRMWVALCFAKDVPSAIKKQQYVSWAESQVSYIFGNNPQKRNFFTGMNIPGCLNEDIGLHANALGSWGGNDDRLSTMISFTPQNRNRLIGALIGGPRWDDTRPNSIADPARYTEVATFYQPCFTGVLANMVSRYGGTPLPPDFPKEFLPDADSDGQGDDIPDPVPSNSFWSCMEFPIHARAEDVPRDASNNQTTPNAARSCEVRITVNNRSRWAPRGLVAASARYYFTLEPGVTVTELRLRHPFWGVASIPDSDRDLYGDADGATLEGATDGVTLLSGAAAMGKVNVVATNASGHQLCYVEVFFRNPTTTSFDYIFDPPSGARPAPRITINPLQTAQNFLLNITPPKPDMNLIWPGGPYLVRFPVSWAKRHDLRHAVLKITFSANSDLTNDWSYALLPARTAYSIPNGGPSNARFIPFYENGVLLCGDIPTTPGQVPPAPPAPPAPNQDYVKALQRAIYYFETQRSGQVSAGVTLPNGTPLPNRVEWRGDSHTASSADGGDLFPTIDLVGGLYEGGSDFTKTAVSMAHAASMMAWSYLDYPNVYNNHAELRDRMLGNLKWISDFFLKSFTYTDPNDASTYKIYLFVTDRLADGSRYANNLIPPNNTTVEWAAAEVIHQLPSSRRPVRRFFYADKDAPYVSHVASIAGALAAASRTFRVAGGSNAGMIAYADQLLTAARRLYNFCFRYTHGANKMLSYTGQNFATTTLCSPCGSATVDNQAVFGVAKNMSGNLVRIEPYDMDDNISNGIQPVADAIATRFEHASGTPTTTGNLYDPPVPDYYEYTGPTGGSGPTATYNPTTTNILEWIHDNMAWAAIWLHLAEQAKTTPNLVGPSGANLINEAGAYARAFIQNAANTVGTSGIDRLGSPVDYKIYATLLLFKLNAPFPSGITSVGSYRNALRQFFMGGGTNAGDNVPITVTPTAPATNRVITNADNHNGLFNFTNNRLRGNGGLRPIIEASLACLAFARYIDLNPGGLTPPTGIITPSATGYTATWGNLRDRLLEIGTRNIDGVLGHNNRRLSYMYGYHSDEIPGLDNVTGLRYVSHLTATGYFAGTSHRIVSTSSNSNTLLANLPAKHVIYGGIATGPDNNLNGNYSMEGGSQTDENTFPRRSGNWTQQGNEPRLYYTAPMMYALAALNPNGVGTLTPDFPQPVVKPLEYSVTARVVSSTSTSTQLRLTLDNRTAWPARGHDNLNMRYYYTLDPSASLTSVTVNGHDGAPAPTVGSPVHVGGDLYYLEISWTGNPIYPIGRDNTRPNTYTPANTQPNEAQFHRRTIVLTLNHNAQWNNSNDWSFAGLISTDKVTQQIPVYSGSTLINGNEPGAYDLETWYDVNNNNVLDVGTDIKLTGTNEVVDFGFIEPNGRVMRNVLIKNNSAAPITLFDNWALPTGFQRAGAGDLTVPGGQTRSITIEMHGIGNATLGGTVRIFNNCANAMENPLRINMRGVVGVAWNQND
jgi:hypothetical protein